MKKLSIVFASFLLFTAFTMLDGERKIPSVDLKTLDGQTFNSSKIANNGKPIVISFWATWCTPCKKELSAISEVYDDWQKELGVKLIAISIDDSKTASKVKSTVDAKGWDYEVYLDMNSDFKRAMNVNNVPHTFVVDGNGNIVWDNNTYVEGGETKLHEVLQKVAKGEKIEK
ncbi:MAG TPA: TlpA disulfide reductase family protein [Bacteroidia bacterium]|jgi:thiol-disulfide isomerase/thioredoxin